MTDPSSRQRGCPTSTKPQLYDSNKNQVFDPRCGVDIRTDWPTYRPNVTLSCN
jgi:hypothetical protein